MENKEHISKELIERLYYEEELSIREIGKKLSITRGQVEGLMETYNIQPRTFSEAMKIKVKKYSKEKKIEAIEDLSRKLSNQEDINKNRRPIPRKNLLIPIPLSNSRDASVTIVISDLHIGDANHLPETYWSTISNVCEVLKNIKSFYNVKNLYLVLNGDIVAGRDIYKSQELRNIIQRGHWQVFLAEMIIKDTLEKLSTIKNIDKIIFIRGTHDSLANNFILYLKRLMNYETLYLSHGGVFNIAGPLGEYNVLFSHGYGWSDVFPVSSPMMRDVLKVLNTYRDSGINIERICSSHSHWISSGFIFENIYWDTTGGFQKWEYTLSQRPAGAIVYLYNNGECVSIPVRPDPVVEAKEKSDVGLEYKNLIYYGTYLLKHLKEIEKIEE